MTARIPSPHIPDFLRKSFITDRIPELRRLKRESARSCAARWAEKAAPVAERISAEIDAERELKRKEEHARYLRDSFAGKCEDWLQWPTDEQKEKALDEIYHALRLPPEDALLRVQLIVSGLIADAATGHTNACQRNGTL